MPSTIHCDESFFIVSNMTHSIQKYAFRVAYDGTNYQGWQKQPNRPTIQGTLEKALAQLQGNSHTPVYGASRTDTGVHAQDQLACFDSRRNKHDYDADRWKYALNAITPDDIQIRRVWTVNEDFNPRRALAAKHYCYRLWEGHNPLPQLRQQFATHPPIQSLRNMRTAARALVGTHDFTAFRAADCQAISPIKTILGITVSRIPAPYRYHYAEDENIIQIDVIGTGFLKHMIRVIAGTLTDIGIGKIKAENINAILEKKDRKLAGKTLPGKGLTLERAFLKDEQYELQQALERCQIL